MPRHSTTAILLSILLLAGCAGGAQSRGKERDKATVDLLRATPGGEKVYVQAQIPGQEPAVFLVDTGAGISAISRGLADRLEIRGRQTQSTLSGLGGESPLVRGVLPEISLGGLAIRNIEVAIDVPGLPSHAGWIPIDGILGNNVWGDFVLALDYPADILEIGKPGTIRVPDAAVPMSFDGNHVLVPVTLHAGSPDTQEVTRSLHLEVDTGARQILLSGSTGEGFEALATEGEEPIFGIGAADGMPVSAFYRHTRRIPISRVEMGGTVIENPGHATWLNYKGSIEIGPPRLTGLLGHAVLSNHRVLMDFPGQRFLLKESTRRERQVNGHNILLEQDLKRYGNDPSRGLFRARMLLAQDKVDAALASLDDYLKVHTDDAEALVTRSIVLRSQGRFEEAITTSAGISAGDLVDHGEILAATNSLVLTGEPAAAERLAQAATQSRPESSLAHLALADVQMELGRPEEAGSALRSAARLRENPDAFLHRRALIALMEGDAYAAVSYLRRRLHHYPTDGHSLWAYALLAMQLPELQATFESDLSQSFKRLHPESLPLDFIAVSQRLMGHPGLAQSTLEEGLLRDCAQALNEASRMNCEAWYLAMAGSELPRALESVESALAADSHRPDFLDTLAIVQEQLGDFEAAQETSLKAARYSPDTLYHLWQHRRLASLAGPE